MQTSSYAWCTCALFVLLLCLSLSQAQLNFSPGWGKRSENEQSDYTGLMESAGNPDRPRGASQLIDVARTTTGTDSDIGYGDCGIPSVSTLMKIFRIIKVRFI
ncbi:Adipokinetic hormone/red pigment concentrating hormone precursor protein, partial [Hyalella azteca]